MMTSRQSGSPIGGEGNSQTTHGSIVVECLTEAKPFITWSYVDLDLWLHSVARLQWVKTIAHLSMGCLAVVISTSDSNSLWRNDAIWQHTSGSTLAQVMASCLTPPSYHLSQFSLVSFCCIHLGAITQLVPKLLFHTMNLKINLLRLLTNLPATIERISDQVLSWY